MKYGIFSWKVLCKKYLLRGFVALCAGVDHTQRALVPVEWLFCGMKAYFFPSLFFSAPHSVILWLK